MHRQHWLHSAATCCAAVYRYLLLVHSSKPAAVGFLLWASALGQMKRCPTDAQTLLCIVCRLCQQCNKKLSYCRRLRNMPCQLELSNATQMFAELHLINPAAGEWPSRSLDMARIDRPLTFKSLSLSENVASKDHIYLFRFMFTQRS